MNIILIIGIFLALFLSVLLITKKNRATSDTLLALWMLAMAVDLIFYRLHLLGYWVKYPHLVGVTHPFPLLYGPFLYLYVSFALRQEQRFNFKDLLHFLPFILMYLWLIPFLFGYSVEEKALSDTQGFQSEFKAFFLVSLIIFILSGVIYPILALIKIKTYRQTINENFAYREHISLQWLKKMILGIIGLFLIAGLLEIMANILQIDFGFNIDYLLNVLLVLFILILGYNGIRHQDIFTDAQSEKIVIVDPKPKAEYKYSGLKKSDARLLHERLQQVMLDKKPYLEPKLTLNKLSESIETSPNYLSQTINQFENKNFYDFVNAYRIDEFIKLATDPKYKNFSILGMAFEAGFNSKSSFNQVFKKNTGQTPSEYLKQFKKL